MNRAELEQLDRDSLIARAQAAGVTRPRILTRPELVDELLLRSAVDEATKQRARGLFGRARDLVARVVERGLHLPDAAERIRSIGGAPPFRPSAPAALPTVTLAEIYVAQGHRGRAIETLERVLAREPDHAAAQGLLSQLRDTTYAVPRPRMQPERDGVEPDTRTAAAAPDEPPQPPAEPTHMLDDAPLPTRYDVDECVAIPVDPTTLYVYWEVRERTLGYLRASSDAGVLALRVVIVVPTWDGPRSSMRDHDVLTSIGDFFVRELPAGCVARVAIGYRQNEVFVPIAHSPAIETPVATEAPMVADALVRWTANGATAVTRDDPSAPAEARHAARARRAGGLLMDTDFAPAPLGSSEQWAEAPSRSEAPARSKMEP